MLKPRALRPGDRIAIVSPASPPAPDQFEAGAAELRALGFDPVYTDAALAREGYLAGSAELRANDFIRAWSAPDIAAIIAVRGGYGSVQILPRLTADLFRHRPKPFVGYSDNTSVITWLMQDCGMVAFHGPMIEGRLAKGAGGYDADTFVRCLCRAEPLGELRPPTLEVLWPGEAVGPLVGGTLTQLVASLGTPYAFAPPPGCILFLDDVGERPYRLDRMLMQLRLSGILGRASAIVFNELPGCDEPGGVPTARDVVRSVLEGFPGPVLFGLPSGHTIGPTLTLPFGVAARVVTTNYPALVIEEAAVS
jgi:muramoyltetrapeptide carboxypeptidase